MARSSVRRSWGVRHHRRCGAFVVFRAFCVAVLCVVAFTPGVVKVVVAAETTSDDESAVGDTTNVSGKKKTVSSFAFATPASKGLSANSLEVRGRCDFFFSSRSMCFVVLWRAVLLFFFAKEKRWERDCDDDEPRLSRGGMSSDVRARSLLLSLSFFHHRPHNR